MTSRDAILNRIRTANSAQPQLSSPPQNRLYRHAPSLPHEALLNLLVDRLRDYEAQVLRIFEHSSLEAGPGIQQAITDRLRARHAERILIPPGLPSEWLPPTIQFVEDTGLAHTQLDTFDGVLTTATLAIAETGTIVLQNAPGQGRRALSLLPDYHLCILKTGQVVETVPAAFDRLAPTAHLPTTFISGPSATADIEMTRIKGVHGPRFLDVLLIETA